LRLQAGVFRRKISSAQEYAVSRSGPEEPVPHSKDSISNMIFARFKLVAGGGLEPPTCGL
jgi:hypothetical protein